MSLLMKPLWMAWRYWWRCTRRPGCRCRLEIAVGHRTCNERSVVLIAQAHQTRCMNGSKMTACHSPRHYKSASTAVPKRPMISTLVRWLQYGDHRKAQLPGKQTFFDIGRQGVAYLPIVSRQLLAKVAARHVLGVSQTR